ncbi:MAG: acyl-CoA dehydrogenase family protein [Pseudomonadota bacterium]
MTDAQTAGGMLADQLDRLLAAVDAPLLQRVEAGQGAGPLGDRLAELGLPLALAPDEKGGAGLGWQEMAPAMISLGAHTAPAGLGEAMVANWALAHAGMEAEETPPAVTADLLEMDDAGRVTGTAALFWAAEGDEALAVARSPDGPRLVRLATQGRAEPLPTLGRDPRLRATWDRAEPLASLHAPLGEATLRASLAALRAAQIAGGLARQLDLSIEHGNTRQQFGRPIGKFQAIQHMIAQLAAEAAAARASVRIALRALDAADADPDAVPGVLPAVAVSKTRTSLAVTRAAPHAHAVHGAIGVTQEHILHHVSRRLWQWREDAGDEHAWSETLGRAALARGGDALWPELVSLSGG